MAIVMGVLVLLLRNYLFISGRETDAYKPENNLANPNRKPTNKSDQRIIVLVGIVLIVAGLLYAIGFLPRQ
jgi:hypothetical protein